ncbi:hypothetical protein BV20DRAFT_728499 [Pilatotrama ljubarskyi]|nr:hypothetical protein BV20DRAFT_728499 [Pilatotrama ljubarskyi]
MSRSNAQLLSAKEEPAYGGTSGKGEHGILLSKTSRTADDARLPARSLQCQPAHRRVGGRGNAGSRLELYRIRSSGTSHSSIPVHTLSLDVHWVQAMVARKERQKTHLEHARFSQCGYMPFFRHPSHANTNIQQHCRVLRDPLRWRPRHASTAGRTSPASVYCSNSGRSTPRPQLVDPIMCEVRSTLARTSS